MDICDNKVCSKCPVIILFSLTHFVDRSSVGSGIIYLSCYGKKQFVILNWGMGKIIEKGINISFCFIKSINPRALTIN